MAAVARITQKLCWPLVITVLLWGGNFVALKVVYRQIQPEALFTLRYFLMYSALLVLCAVTKTRLKIQRGDLGPVMYFGFISMGLYLILFITGMKDSSAAEGALILALAPLMTACGEMLTRQQPFSPKVILGGLVAIGGVALVVFGSGHAQVKGHLIGNLIVFSSAIVWAYSALLMRPLLQRYSALQLMTVSLPGALPVIAFTFPVLLKTNLAAFDWGSRLSITHIAIGSGVFGFVLFYEGVRRIGPAKAVTYQYFTPVTTALFAWPILGAAITLTQVAGIGIVVAGLLIARRPVEVAAEEEFSGESIPDPAPGEGTLSGQNSTLPT